MNFWNQITPIYEAILCHPFNQGLMAGTLPKETFLYYIEQDALYLKDFARSLAMIAVRFHETSLIQQFLQFAQGALIAEGEVVHEHYRKMLASPIEKQVQLSPATLSYTHFLLSSCSLEAVEVAVASVLPCFWIYREVGCEIAKHAAAENPYARWIETYSSEEFSEGVERAISITDQMAQEASPSVQKQMAAAFQKSVLLEWHFWNDAYHMKTLESCIMTCA